VRREPGAISDALLHLLPKVRKAPRLHGSHSRVPSEASPNAAGARRKSASRPRGEHTASASGRTHREDHEDQSAHADGLPHHLQPPLIPGRRRAWILKLRRARLIWLRARLARQARLTGLQRYACGAPDLCLLDRCPDDDHAPDDEGEDLDDRFRPHDRERLHDGATAEPRSVLPCPPRAAPSLGGAPRAHRRSASSMQAERFLAAWAGQFTIRARRRRGRRSRFIPR
jgi:hypothetical protein